MNLLLVHFVANVLHHCECWRILIEPYWTTFKIEAKYNKIDFTMSSAKWQRNAVSVTMYQHFTHSMLLARIVITYHVIIIQRIEGQRSYRYWHVGTIAMDNLV